jgi:hypothetical protein
MEETRYDRTAGCYRLELELQAYLEGEERPFVLAHTRECAFCRVMVEDLEGLRAAARELPLEEPSPVVWSNIRAQLAAAGSFVEKASFWDWLGQLDFLRRPIPVAAFACVVVLGCVLTASRNNPEQDLSLLPTAPEGRTAVRSMAFIGDSAALEQVVRELEKAFKAREASLAPDVKATYENSLNSLDTSIRECNDSLRREPGNSLAHEYLLAAYSQKAEVLSSALEFDEGR